MSEPPSTGRISDVNAHGIAYALLGALMLRGTAGGRWTGVGASAAAAAAALSIAYGFSDEWHQSVVAGRTAELRDLVADSIGAIAGVTLVWAWSIVVNRGTHDCGDPSRRAS